MSENIEEWLEKRGCPHHIAHAGLKGLLESWKQTARELAEGWNVKIESKPHDLEIRQLIFELEQKGELDEAMLKELHRIDRMFLASSTATATNVFGDHHAQANKWTPETNWWFYRKS